MESKSLGPTEEILKALDEIVDVNFEETRRTRKRSSILKQPKISEDEQGEDLQNKRKSFTSKRRVSFAEKFQVMELCTGNVYDIPGKSVSASDSTLNGDLNLVSKSEVENFSSVSKLEGADSNDTNIDISRNKIKVSISTEITQMENEEHMLCSRKHKVNSDENIEPERKRINVMETSSFPLDLDKCIFKGESLQFKNYLSCNDYTKNDKENQNMESTLIKNADMSSTSICDILQKHDLAPKQFNLTNPRISSQNAEYSHILSNSENVHATHKSNSNSTIMVEKYKPKDGYLSFLGNKSNLNLENQFLSHDVLKDASNVEFLPVSVCDVSLEENKENIFIDVKNKNILITNASDLTLNRKRALQISQVTKPDLGYQISEKRLFTSSLKTPLDIDNCNSESVKKQTIAFEQKGNFLDKTSIWNHSMDLTCVPSEINLINKLEQSTDDENVIKDNMVLSKKWDITEKLNKTCLDTSLFMELTCNVQNLSDSLCSVNSNCDVTKQHLTNSSIQFNTKHLEEDEGKNIDVMEMTCAALNLSESLSVSTENDFVKEQNLLNQSMKFNKDREENVEFVDDCSKTKYFSSVGMELTCDVKSKTNLRMHNELNVHSYSESQLEKVFCINKEIDNSDRNVNCDLATSEKPFENPLVLNMSTDIDPVLPETGNTNLDVLHNLKRAQLINDEMEITCYERDISTEGTDNLEISVDNTLHKQSAVAQTPSLSDDEVFVNEDCKSKHQKVDFVHNSEKMKSCVFYKKQDFNRKETNFESLLNPAHPLDNNTNSAVTQHFTFDFQGLTAKTCSDEDIIKNANPIKSFSKTNHFSCGMDLTCDFDSSINSNHAKRSLSQSEEFIVGDCALDKIHPAKHQRLEFMNNFEKSGSNDIDKKLNSAREEKIPQVLPSTIHSSENDKVSIFTDKTRYFTSDFMELTRKTCSIQNENKKDVSPLKSPSKTKYFSSLGMELTCDVVSNVRNQCFSDTEVFSKDTYSPNNTHNPQKSNSNIYQNMVGTRHENLPLNPVFLSDNHHNSVVNKVNCLASDLMKSNSKVCLVEDKKNKDTCAVQSFSKTKCFSSYGMELTCDLQNRIDSYIDVVPDSPADPKSSSKSLKTLDKPEMNTALSNKCVDVVDSVNSQVENHLRKAENCLTNASSVVCEIKKKYLSNKLPNKSNDSYSKQALANTETANGHLQEENFVKESNLSVSLKTPNPIFDFSTTNKRQYSYERNNNITAVEDVDLESDYKVVESAKSSESDIVYAIKQVKGMNQALASDYNLFKFPEVYLSLKKRIRPKTSFSCSRIQLTKAVQDAIRKSSSFSYPSSELNISEFNEKCTPSSSKNNKLVKFDKNTNKENRKSVTPVPKSVVHQDVPYSSQMTGSTSTCQTIKKSLFIQYCHSPQQNMPSDNEDILKRNNPPLNSSSESNCLRSSISKDKNACNMPSLIISHVHEESIVKKVTTVIEDTFHDDRTLYLDDCSLSLVSNDDICDSVSFKLRSKTLENSTSCPNQPLDQSLNRISFKNDEVPVSSSSVSKSPKNASKNFSENNSWSLKQNYVPQEEKVDQLSENHLDNVFIPTPIELNVDKNSFSKGHTQNLTKQKCITEILDADQSFSAISNKRIKNDKNIECNLKSSHVSLSSRADKEVCSDIFMEKQNSSELKDCIRETVDKTNDSSEKHKQMVNEKSVVKPSKLSNDQNGKEMNKLFDLKQNSIFHQSCTEKETKIEEIVMNEKMEIVIRDKFPTTVTEINDEVLEKNNVSISNENRLVRKDGNNTFFENNQNNASVLNSPKLIKNNVENMDQNSVIEKQTQCTFKQKFSTEAINEASIQISKHHKGDVNEVHAPHPSNNLKSQDGKTSGISCSEVQNSNVLEKSYVLINKEVNVQSALDRINEAVLPLNPLKDQRNTCPILSKDEQNSSIIKEHEMMITTPNENDQNIVGKNSNKEQDINMEELNKVQDNVMDDNTCVGDSYEKIHSLRRKFMEASKNENCLWNLRELDDKQAIFEILSESVFACYLMYVHLSFDAKIPSCTKIYFKHRNEDPDEIDELGFSLFQSFVMDDKEMFPFSVDLLLDKLAKFIDFALRAKSLIKDIWCVAIRNEITIDNSNCIPQLSVAVLNQNRFSYFSLNFSINLKSYPNEKIVPEIKHLDYNHLKNEMILDALQKVQPGAYYLNNMVKAANVL